MAVQGSEDTVLAQATEPDGVDQPVGETIDLPSNEPDHKESAPNVLRQKPPGERYKLGVELGRGGMGRVVEAFDVQLGRTVALKEVLPSITGTPRRFAREVQITARLEHPAIVPLYDAGVGPDGRPFYVMRRVSGRPLDELLGRAKKLDERLVLLPAVLSAIDAIAHAHKRGVIHRDLKPANILVGDLGETVVIDWGLAKVIGEEDEIEGTAELSAGDSLQTQFGAVFGTPGFMSPEQARGEELGTEGDVYALGACLYQLLAGRPPHVGKSASELLASTHKNQVKPLDEAAPEAPVELIAVVEKALAFDANRRYQNAAALGEDVRRFLTGQLVKAHRYSRRERLQRFARRNRTALVVGAFALVALAVLSWVGVSKITRERALAVAARDDAKLQQQEAERARDREIERAEMMTVQRARGLVTTNPTEAIALLKQIQTSKRHAAELRSIAKAAAVRGVAYGLEAPLEPTFMIDMSRDGKRLVQTTRSGQVVIWDLEHRKVVVARKFGRDPRATWVDGGKLVLVAPREEPPVLYDPATGRSEALPLSPISSPSASGDGLRVTAIDDQHHPILLDLPTRKITQLAPEHRVEQLDISHGGTYVVLSDKKVARAISVETGAEVARFDQEPPQVAVISDHRMAVTTSKVVYELDLTTPKAAWKRIPRDEKTFVLTLQYMGTGTAPDDLVIMTIENATVWNGTRLEWGMPTREISQNIVPVGDGILLLPNEARGEIRYARDELSGTIKLPTTLGHAKVTGGLGHGRVAMTGDGMLLIFDLSHLVPETMHFESNELYYVDDDTLIHGGVVPVWAWHDLKSGRRTEFQISAKSPMTVTNTDPTTGRVCVVGSAEVGIARKGSMKLEIVIEGPDPIARVIEGGPVVAGMSDGRVMVAYDGKPATELVKVDGSVMQLSTDRKGWFAAIGARGELVRGKLASPDLERTRVTPGSTMVVVSDAERTIFTVNEKLSVWEGGRIDEVVKFEQPVTWIAFLGNALVVSLADNSAYTVDLGTKELERVFPHMTGSSVGRMDGKMLAGIEHAGEITFVDMPERTRWTIPTTTRLLQLGNVSPNGQRMITSSFGRAMIWTLPTIGTDVPKALEDLTNATIDGDLLVWPWQHATITP